MFEAVFEPAGLFKAILEALQDLITDVQIECSSEGMAIQSMDSAHVALVQLMLPSTCFVQYRCDRGVALGLNLPSLHKLIKTADNKDTVELSAQEGGDSLIIKLKGKTRRCRWALKLMDIEADRLGIPEMEWHSMITIPAKEFQYVCKSMSLVADTITVTTTSKPNKVEFSGKGDLSDGTIEYVASTVDGDPWGRIEVEILKPLALSFSLRYLSFMTKATSLSNFTVIKMHKETPLCVEYSIRRPLGDDDAQSYGFVRYYLAPKIEG